MHKQWRMKVIMLMVVCGIILALARWHELFFLSLDEKTQIIKYWIHRMGVWSPLAYIIIFVLRPLVFFPAAPAVILSGLLFGGLWGTIYAFIGAMCSGVCEFLFVRRFAGERTKRFLNEKMRAVDWIIKKHGFLAVLLVRVIPNVAFDLQSCGLAIWPIKFTDYFYGTMLGCLPACVFYANFGGLVLNQHIIWKTGFIIFFGIILYLFYIFLKRKYVIKK